MAPAAGLANVARANRGLEALWRSRLLPPPCLTAEALESVALRGAPPSAFGRGEHWRAPYRALLDSLRDEAALNALGKVMAHGQIVMALRARIRAHALWQADPGILQRPIRAPIIILGQMRSGTTRLQRLLACDDRFAHTRMQESLIPVPLRRGRLGDPRRLRARLGLAMLHRLNPEIGRIHPTAPDAPEEEFGLFSFGFGSPQFEAQWQVPSFTRRRERDDARPLYREIKALLQTNGWYRGEDADKPWLLKAPQFLEDMPVLLETFPDARLICLQRPLREVVASSASLVWNQMRVQSDCVDPRWIGTEWLRKTRRRARIAAETRRARTDVPQIEVAYEAMNRDWRGQIRRIYDFLGMEPGDQVMARMEAYLAGAKGHLGHRYSLEQFGLSDAQVASEG